MKTKIIDINNKYYVKINSNENKSLYVLKDTKEDKTICESFNGESFLLKVNKIVKLTNKQEVLIVSY